MDNIEKNEELKDEKFESANVEKDVKEKSEDDKNEKVNKELEETNIEDNSEKVVENEEEPDKSNELDIKEEKVEEAKELEGKKSILERVTGNKFWNVSLVVILSGTVIMGSNLMDSKDIGKVEGDTTKVEKVERNSSDLLKRIEENFSNKNYAELKDEQLELVKELLGYKDVDANSKLIDILMKKDIDNVAKVDILKEINEEDIKYIDFVKLAEFLRVDDESVYTQLVRLYGYNNEEASIKIFKDIAINSNGDYMPLIKYFKMLKTEGYCDINKVFEIELDCEPVTWEYFSGEISMEDYKGFTKKLETKEIGDLFVEVGKREAFTKDTREFNYKKIAEGFDVEFSEEAKATHMNLCTISDLQDQLEYETAEERIVTINEEIENLINMMLN